MLAYRNNSPRIISEDSIKQQTVPKLSEHKPRKGHKWYRDWLYTDGWFGKAIANILKRVSWSSFPLNFSQNWSHRNCRQSGIRKSFLMISFLLQSHWINWDNCLDWWDNCYHGDKSFLLSNLTTAHCYICLYEEGSQKG